MTSNVTMLKWMLSEGYGDKRTIERCIASMEDPVKSTSFTDRRVICGEKTQFWMEDPVLMKADPKAEYSTIIEIDLNKITEPILCAPNDPDDARLLSEVRPATF